uniref:Uncharacterized protein n=1 Tax=Arundo donax TaxID=35708 RepID=A0A0A8YL53_ARUDO
MLTANYQAKYLHIQCVLLPFKKKWCLSIVGTF